MEKIGPIQASEIREKAIKGDKEAARQYLRYAIVRRLRKEGYTEINAQKIADVMMTAVNVTVEVDNG